MQRGGVAEPITAAAERTTVLSDTIALIYESEIDESRLSQARQAIKALVGADEMSVVTGPADYPGRTAIGSGILHLSPRSDARSLGHVLWLDIGESEAGPVRIQFRRRPEAPPFSDEDVQILSLLRRHLRTAHCLRSLTQNDAFGCLVGSHLSRSMVKGLVLTDSQCQIKWRNPAAAEILAREDGLFVDKGQLRARRAFETARLESLTQQAANGNPGVMLVCRTAERQPYGLALARLKSESGTLLPDMLGRTIVLITIKQMQRQIKLITERLGTLFGLTPAEERIGALLLDGYTLQDAAKMENKALTTVKTQLRSMLKKTGTHSQTELMNVFLSLPCII